LANAPERHGTTYFKVRNWAFQEGSSFTQNDVDMSANVAVIGETVRKSLFGAADPLGQTSRQQPSLPRDRRPDSQRNFFSNGRRSGYIILITANDAAKESHRPTLVTVDHGFHRIPAGQHVAQQADCVSSPRSAPDSPGGPDDFRAQSGDLADVADEAARDDTVVASIASVCSWWAHRHHEYHACVR